MIDLSNPTAFRLEAERRQTLRAKGLPLHEPKASNELVSEDDLHWSTMQKAVAHVFTQADCTVYWLSQARRTGQTPGLPDLLLWGPPGAPFLAFWETKAGQGKLSEAQKAFQRQCQRCHVRFGSGGANTARKRLAEWVEESSVPQRGAHDR